ncbi:hypothetical protein OAP56_02675 [Rickettsiaceae bacterium]|nr:hypothetical protein [Rickettsiaceae bacterium]
MNNKLSKILKLAGDLTKSELMMLNQAVVSLIKTQQDVDFKKAAITFQKGDIVSFKDSSGVRVQGVVTKKNPKTLQVTTPDDYYVNIPATYVSPVNNPSRKLLDFKKKVAPSFEEMREALADEIEKGTFH